REIDPRGGSDRRNREAADGPEVSGLEVTTLSVLDPDSPGTCWPGSLHLRAQEPPGAVALGAGRRVDVGLKEPVTLAAGIGDEEVDHTPGGRRHPLAGEG